MIHYFRLLRPVNLFIVGLTMYVLAWFFDVENGCKTVLSIDFFLIVFSTMLIAGAGNVINDCYDINLDKINKPEKVIVGNSISIERVRTFYFSLSSIGLIVCFYTSYIIKHYSFLAIYILTILLLWLYSARLKRTLFLGNFVVSILTAVIPMLVVLFFSIVHSTVQFNLPVFGPSYDIVQIGFFFSILAFLLNFSREVIKDIEDIEGDRRFFGNTIPIKFGIRSAKIMASIPLLLAGVFLIIFAESTPFSEMKYLYFPTPIILLTLLSLFNAKKSQDYHKAGNELKYAIFFGVILPIFPIVN